MVLSWMMMPRAGGREFKDTSRSSSASTTATSPRGKRMKRTFTKGPSAKKTCRDCEDCKENEEAGRKRSDTYQDLVTEVSRPPAATLPPRRPRLSLDALAITPAAAIDRSIFSS